MNVTLTPKEASERFWSAGLKINPKEVVDLAVQGLLPGSKRGFFGRWQIPERAVINYIKAQKIQESRQKTWWSGRRNWLKKILTILFMGGFSLAVLPSFLKDGSDLIQDDILPLMPNKVEISESSDCGVSAYVLRDDSMLKMNPGALREQIAKKTADLPIVHGNLDREQKSFSGKYSSIIQVSSRNPIRLGNRLRVEVEIDKNISSHVNAVDFSLCPVTARTVDAHFSPPVLLTSAQTYPQMRRSSSADYFEVDHEILDHEIFNAEFQCAEPGMYKITISLFNYPPSSVITSHSYRTLACPRSFTLWSLDMGKIKNFGVYEWDGSNYVRSDGDVF